MGVRYIRSALRRGALALALPAVAAAQAAAEYAAKSSAGAVSGAAGDLHMGVCRVDTSLFRCMHDYYPLTFKVTVVGGCLILAAVVIRTLRVVR